MSKRPLDLDSLPPELRRVVEQQLAKLPPAAREKLLREGSPLIEKMLAKVNAGQGRPPPLPGGRTAQESVQSVANSVSAAADRAGRAAERIERMLPRGHYNATIRPGDSGGIGGWVVGLFVFVGLIVFLWR